jgi:hypothetical protein
MALGPTRLSGLWAAEAALVHLAAGADCHPTFGKI